MSNTRKGKVGATIDPIIKKQFNDFCNSRGLSIMGTTKAVIEKAMRQFIDTKIKTVKEQLEEQK